MQNKEYQSILRRCPFCGGEASVIAKVVYKHVLYYVQCKDCGVTNHPYAVEQGVIAPKYEDIPSIKAWNRREPLDKIVEQLEVEVERARTHGLCITDRRNIMQGLLKAIEIVKSGGAE